MVLLLVHADITLTLLIWIEIFRILRWSFIQTQSLAAEPLQWWTSPSKIFCALCKFSWRYGGRHYPWDTWARLHPDDAWWQFISHQFADTAQANSPSTYMNQYNDESQMVSLVSNNRRATGLYDYFRRGREATIEISDVNHKCFLASAHGII